MVDDASDPNRRPDPDPTVLTTEQLLREVATSQKLFMTELRCMRELIDEKMASVTLRFGLIDDRTREQKDDTKAAVDAALQAAKEAVGKTEVSTKEQLAQLGLNFSTAIDAMDTKFSDLKDRVGNIESTKRGGQQAYAGLYMLAGFIVMLTVLVGFVVAFAAGK